MIKVKLRTLLFLMLSISSFSASANGYLGFSYGSTDVKADLSPVGGGSIDSSTTLTKYYGGYRFIKYLALEAAYFNLAELSTDSLGTSPGMMTSGAVDMRAIGIYGVGFLPLTQSIQVYAKAGAANWDASLRRDNMTESVSDTDALYGAGISYHFKKTFGITLDWEVIDSPNPEFNTFSIGFKWEFL